MKKLIFLFAIACLTGCGSQTGHITEVPEIFSEPTIIIEETTTEGTEAEEPATPEPTTIETATEEENMNPDRITYKTDFYYEPLSDDIKKRITGLSYADNCTVPYEDLRYVCVQYMNFDGKTKTGEIICNKAIAEDLVEIFYELYEAEYPIEKIHLVDEYNADDELSCLDDNSSCFNFRFIANTTKLSNHSYGKAIDINPLYNPYITWRDGVENVFPYTAASYANRDADFIAKINHEDLCYKLFTEHGFTWGGDWSHAKDYQHFEKK